jgi:N-sulfoglucosamine sulfohydrolase
VITGAAAAPFLRTARAAGRRPNFLFLLTDDQSYASTSLTGSSFMKTPNMDRIGREGVLFTNAFVAMSLCAPSRACFLTGL